MSSTVSSPAARRSRTPSIDVERELIAAAEAVLVRDGPGGLTVRAVAAQAKIAPMGVYSRLGGKDGLVDALLIRGFDRLRAVVASGDEPDPLDRLRACALRYREFALANKHLYAIMFEGAIPRESRSERESGSDEVGEHARASFDQLISSVTSAAAAGAITAPEPREVAQRIWSTIHGAVALELKDLVLTPDPEVTYRATVDMVIRGLAA